MTSLPHCSHEAIAWKSWTASTIAQAEATGTPIVLALGPAWCEGCARMDRTVYADPDVSGLIRNRFIPIRVDADRRPDIAERYTVGGWPTTACLTPQGELLAGGVLLDVPGLTSMLIDVNDACQTRPDEIVARARAAVEHRAEARRAPLAPAPELVDAAPDWLDTFARDAFDARHGGFGDRPKWPHTGVLRLWLRRYRETGQIDIRDRVSASLDAMVDGGLFDAVEGGFFRYADSADWSSVHSEKLLEVNAECLSLYLDAWATFGRSRDRETVEAVLGFLGATLWDATEVAFFASQRADAAYYGVASVEARHQVDSPPVDRTVYVGANARMVSALLMLAEATRDAAVGERALAVLERLLLPAYRPGHGVAHVVEAEPSVWGQLGDQVWTCHATLDAFEASGDDAYLDLSQELMLYSLRTMWDEARGGFFDRAPADDGTDIGLLRDPLKPIDLNGAAARALVRLSRITGRQDFSVHATETLASCEGTYRSHGLGAAPYVLAVVEATEPDLAEPTT